MATFVAHAHIEQHLSSDKIIFNQLSTYFSISGAVFPSTIELGHVVQKLIGSYTPHKEAQYSNRINFKFDFSDLLLHDQIEYRGG